MIQGISEKLDGLVQSLKVAGAQNSASATQPPSGNAVAQQRSDVVGGIQQVSPANAPDVKSQAMKDVVDKLNKDFKTSAPHVSISVDNEANRYIIRYKDPNSGEVIQQMPPEGVLEMARQYRGDKGLLFNSEG